MSESEAQIFRTNAVLLLSKRNDEGRFMKDGMELAPTDASKLLGSIESINDGQGGLVLMIPEHAVERAGLDISVWNKVAETGRIKKRNWKERPYYTVDNNFAVQGVLPILELWSGKEWNEARSLAEEYKKRGDISIA